MQSDTGLSRIAMAAPRFALLAMTAAMGLCWSAQIDERG